MKLSEIIEFIEEKISILEAQSSHLNPIWRSAKIEAFREVISFLKQIIQ